MMIIIDDKLQKSQGQVDLIQGNQPGTTAARGVDALAAKEDLAFLVFTQMSRDQFWLLRTSWNPEGRSQGSRFLSENSRFL